MIHIDAVASKGPNDRGPESVRPDAPNERDGVLQPGQTDRDVCFGTGDIGAEAAGVCERAVIRPHEGHQALPERDDLRTAGHSARRPFSHRSAAGSRGVAPNLR